MALVRLNRDTVSRHSQHHAGVTRSIIYMKYDGLQETKLRKGHTWEAPDRRQREEDTDEDLMWLSRDDGEGGADRPWEGGPR